MELERQTLNLAPDRWIQLYKDRVLGNVADPEEVNLEIDDLAELDRYMAKQEQAFQETLLGTHTMSGAQAPAVDWRADQADHLSWGPWS